MSLYEEAMTQFVFLEKHRVPDGRGGFYTEWHESAEFPAAVAFDNSMQAKTAQKQGVTSVYTVYTKKSVEFEYHDIIKRLEDGKIFRITSNGKDKKTPKSAALSMLAVSAEEWELPR